MTDGRGKPMPKIKNTVMVGISRRQDLFSKSILLRAWSWLDLLKKKHSAENALLPDTYNDIKTQFEKDLNFSNTKGIQGRSRRYIVFTFLFQHFFFRVTSVVSQEVRKARMNNKENVDSTGPPSQLDDESSASGLLGLGKRKHEEPSSGRVAKERRYIHEKPDVWSKRCQEYHRELDDKGTTQKDYAEAHGFPYANFHYWWTKYKKEKGLLPPAPASLAKEQRIIFCENPEVWYKRCQEYHRELDDKGTSQKEYARIHGYPYKTFTRWCLKYKEAKGLLQTTGHSKSRPAVGMSQEERNGNTDDMKTKATKQNSRNGDHDLDRRQTKPQEPAPLHPPQPTGTVRGNPQPVEAHASIPPAAAVAIKTDPTYRHFHVDIDGEVESQRLVRLQESCNDTLTFHDLRHAIRDQLSWGENISFQFIVGRYLLYPRQETWNVKEYIRVDSEADGSFWKPYQVTIKVLPPHEPQPDSVGSIVDV